MAYKLVKKNERKYYKYNYESWEQPFLTSNGTMGGNTPAASASNTHGSYDGQPWRAFDGVGSAGWATNNAAPPQWIMFYNPTPFQLQSVTITPRAHLWTAYTVQGSNDGITFEDIQSFQLPWWYSEPVTSNIDSENQRMYKYYRFYITMTTDNNVDVMQIGLSGIVRSIIESDETDYDYYEDVTSYKLVKIAGDSTAEVAWTQPPFADWIGNNDGIWDTSRLYTCTCDGSHNPTDQGGVASLAGSNNGWHTTTSYLPHWVGYYTEPIKVSKFGFQVDATTTYIPTAFHWDGSNDGSTWTTLGSFIRNNTLTTYEEYTIPEANRGMYKYHRLYITSGNNSRYCFVCNVNITATKEGTPDTYYVISRE